MTDVGERLAALATPTLFEADPERVTVLDGAIRPVFQPIRLVGPAFTVTAQPGDNLAIHRALAEAGTGSVLVVITERDVRHGFFGEVMMEAAIARGIAGLVIDGGVRDTAAFRERGFPVFAGGIAIRGTVKSFQGGLGEMVTVAGAHVQPGDWIVGDDDGVVVVPADGIDEIMVRGEARVAKEAALIQRIRAGETTLEVLGLRDAIEAEARTR